MHTGSMPNWIFRLGGNFTRGGGIRLHVRGIQSAISALRQIVPCQSGVWAKAQGGQRNFAKFSQFMNWGAPISCPTGWTDYGMVDVFQFNFTNGVGQEQSRLCGNNLGRNVLPVGCVANYQFSSCIPPTCPPGTTEWGTGLKLVYDDQHAPFAVMAQRYCLY
jgi:hypothetical protein